MRIGACLVFGLCTLVAHAHVQTPSLRYALPAPEARYTVQAPGVDRASALAADLGRPKSAPLRYALTREIHNVALSRNSSQGGEWRDLPDGMALWRLPVHAAGALTLDFGFRKFFLPPGAQLFIGNAAQQLGPYGDADNPRSGQFWTPLLHGDRALIEVLLPQSMKPFLRLDLGTVHVGYRDIFAPATRPKSFYDPAQGSGSCNLDTICSQGDAWRREIAAEAVVVTNGGFCSGQLLNDTRGDHARLFSTAQHCLASQADANSLVVYWKYESPVCRIVGSSADAQPVPTDTAIPQTGGATLLATYPPADFTLVRLNAAIPAAAQVYWNGWDRSENPFSGAVVMHHAEADAKRISFTAGSILTDNTDYGQDIVPGINHWRVDHYALGTTQEGSSGSGLIDANHHLRGVLSGGDADCSDPSGDDFYGRLSTAWNGGGTPATRLRDWLDPIGTQPQSIDGSGSCTAPTVILSSSENPALAGDRVRLSASATGGVPPYTFAFDVDGDGVADSFDANAASLVAVYPAAFSGNVGVTVTDSSGCVGSASRALVVRAQNVGYEYPFEPPLTLVCGEAANGFQPGQRWQIGAGVQNVGTAPTSNGYAVFAQDLNQPDQAKITLEHPVVALPTLAPFGDDASTPMTFTIAADAACGTSFSIEYLGTADDNGFTSNPHTILAATIAAQCQPQTCTAQVTPILPRAGNYYDPLRPGNGMTLLVTKVPGNDPVFFGAWFSGDAQRHPTWYVVNDALHANQVNSVLAQTQQSTPTSWPVRYNHVGNAQVSLIAPDKFVYTWMLNGSAGGAIYVPVVADPARSLQAWYNPNESGWGTFDEFFPAAGANGLPFLFQLTYIYDDAGNPRWTAASDAGYRDGDTLTASVARPSCPGCVWLDYTLGAQPVGSIDYHLDVTPGTISTDLVLPSAYPGKWIRDHLPLIPPQ